MLERSFSLQKGSVCFCVFKNSSYWPSVWPDKNYNDIDARYLHVDTQINAYDIRLRTKEKLVRTDISCMALNPSYF